MDEVLSVIQLEEDLWMIDDGLCHCYLVVGKKKALLMDTGLGIGDLRGAISTVTDLPVELLISHEHLDHLGGIGQFSEAYINQRVASCLPPEVTPHFVGSGYVFDLGGVELEVLEQPGHSVGEISLLNRAAGYLLVGDVFEEGRVLLHCATSDVHQYLATLEQTRALDGIVQKLYPAHLSYPLDMAFVDRLYGCVTEYLKGERKLKPFHFVVPGKDIWVHEFAHGGVSITVP